MNEVQRFMRFSLPGLATMLVLLIALVVSEQLKFDYIIEGIKGSSGIGVVTGIFLGSAVLGFLLANVYFALMWRWRFQEYIAWDHVEVIKKLQKQGTLRVEDIDGNQMHITEKREAWDMMTTYRFAEGPESFDEYHRFMGRLVDTTHSIGTTILGLCLTGLLWILTYVWRRLIVNTDYSYWAIASLAIFALLIFLFCLAYNKAKQSAERINHSLFAADIQRRGSRLRPVRIPYVKL